MTHFSRQLMRVALEISDRLKTTAQTPIQFTLPSETWLQAEALQRMIRKANQQCWRLAAERLGDELRRTLLLIRNELMTIDRAFNPAPIYLHVASFHDIRADIVALQAEFDGVTIDHRNRTLSATTEPIVLEGVELGPFEIQLGWNRRDQGFSPHYRVIALEPNPASSNQSVTHPHVQDEGLCEGEGRTAIRDALEQGRLFDFFVIVANLLRTYNSGSPYVSLSDWRGIDCGDCGDSVAEDEGWTCDHCSTTVCGECHIQCPSCQDTYCNGCVVRCAGCEELHCHSCLRLCSGCQTEFCPDCLDENERCDACHETESTDESDETSASVGVPAEG